MSWLLAATIRSQSYCDPIGLQLRSDRSRVSIGTHPKSDHLSTCRALCTRGKNTMHSHFIVRRAWVRRRNRIGHQFPYIEEISRARCHVRRPIPSASIADGIIVNPWTLEDVNVVRLELNYDRIVAASDCDVGAAIRSDFDSDWPAIRFQSNHSRNLTRLWSLTIKIRSKFNYDSIKLQLQLNYNRILYARKVYIYIYK